MTSRLLAVTFAAREPERVALFWSGLLDRDLAADADGVLLAGNDAQVGLRFARSRVEKREPNRVHLHLTSDRDDQSTMVERAVALGASHLDVGQLPDETHVVLGDPEGNELCVIPPGNSFLAGCGLLGEVACDGTRAVGVFWGQALGWPLVWDENEETAIQSPRGGTKVAWGGPPVSPLTVPARQWFELLAKDDEDDADEAGDAEVERLVSLGATRVGQGDDGVVVLADPDGNEFRLRREPGPAEAGHYTRSPGPHGRNDRPT